MKKHKKNDYNINVIGHIYDIHGDGTFTVSFKNKMMKEPFMVEASCGHKITNDMIENLKNGDRVTLLLDENDLHKGIIINTPY